MQTRDMTDEQKLQTMANYANVLLSHTRMNQGEFMRLIDSNTISELGIAKALELIGEHAYYVSPSGRSEYSAIDYEYWSVWRQELTHGYTGVAKRDMWDAVWKHIPALCGTLEDYGFAVQETQ